MKSTCINDKLHHTTINFPLAVLHHHLMPELFYHSFVHSCIRICTHLLLIIIYLCTVYQQVMVYAYVVTT